MAVGTEQREENLLWGTTKFLYTFEALKMLKRSPMEGYYVPWTKFTGKNRYARLAGRRIGGDIVTRRGIGFGAHIADRAMRETAKRTGTIGAAKAAFGRGAGTLTKSAGTKLLIGRVAGLALGAFEVYWAAQLLALPFQAYSAIAQQVQSYRGVELGGYFPETKGSITSRQRTVRAITDSRLQARSAIGNEAQLFHR